jgi:hypothetical protein
MWPAAAPRQALQRLLLGQAIDVKLPYDQGRDVLLRLPVSFRQHY